MYVENIVFIYLTVCIAMIIFNCACIVFFHRRDWLIQRYSEALRQLIRIEFKTLDEKGVLSETHLSFLNRRLIRINALFVFDATLEILLKEEAVRTQRYIDAVQPVFIRLTQSNHYRNGMERAYFAYFIKKYHVLENNPLPAVVEFMMTLLKEPSLYCRENAMQVLYSTGDAEIVLRALGIVEESLQFYHSKLLTDGLLSFKGDSEKLMMLLWEHFEEFSVPIQIAILDFVRFGEGHLEKAVLSLLVDEKRDDELRFSCIRYFGKMPYEEAFPILLELVERSDEKRWEYAAIAATALSAYPSERTIQVLKLSLSSPNWYLRFNAAKSLEALHLTYLDLSDIMNGDDRYAREILQYQFDMKRAQMGKAVDQA